MTSSGAVSPRGPACPGAPAVGHPHVASWKLAQTSGWESHPGRYRSTRGLRQLRHPQAPQRQGLADQAPRVQLHFTPTSGSWLNMEIFFAIITRQAIRRGTFHSVKDLETAIGTYIDGWNERAHPFTWTKGADEIISHAKPSPHQKKTRRPHR